MFIIIFFLTLIIGGNVSASSDVLYEVSVSRIHEVREKFGDLFWNYVVKSDKEPQQVSDECFKKLRSVINSNSTGKKWSQKLISSSGQFPDNFEKGTLSDFGNFDQCMAFRFPISTHYCVASFILKKEFLVNRTRETEQISSDFIEFVPGRGLTLKIGICTPQACSSNDLSIIFDAAIQNSNWTQIEKCRCQEQNSSFNIVNHSILNCIAFIFMIMIVLLVLWAGVQDILTMASGPENISNLGFLYYCFSPKNNLIDLFTTNDEVRWRRIDKLRLFSYQVVIIMHLGVWPILFMPSLFGNMTRLRSAWQNFLLQPMINSYYFEGLMALGGLSSGIAIWQKTNKNTRLMEYLAIIIRRFLLIQPIALATVFLEITVSYFFSGPGSLVLAGIPSEDCQKDIFHHITQTKSVFGKDILCAPHLWSISTEFYLSVMTVSLIYLYHHDKIRAKVTMMAISLGGFFYSTSIFYVSEIQPGFIVYPFEPRKAYSYITDYYMSISTHIWLFAYAVLWALLLVEKFDQKIPVKWLQRCITISKVLFIICSFSSSIFNVYGYIPNALTSTIYITLLHLTLAFYLTWTIVSDANEGRKMIFSKICGKNTDSGPDFRKISSNVATRKARSLDWLQIFLRVSRIAYFSHAIIILSFYTGAKKPIDPLSSGQIFTYIVMYLCILASAPIFHILITGPYSRILRWSKASKAEKMITTEKLKTT